MRHILIVDDTPKMQLTLGAILKHKGYRTTTARSAAAARQALCEARPDLILLDIMLPGMNGMCLLEDLHQRREWKDIPVVVLAGRDDCARLARRLGAQDYLV